MRQLLPEHLPRVDPASVYGEARRPPPGRPWVVANMVASLDGVTAVRGRAGPLGGEADRSLFRLLRSLADVVLVGAGTVRAERYGPVRLPEQLRAQRRAAGQPDVPPLAVVSRSLDLDPISPLFTEADPATVVVTPTDVPARRRHPLAGVAELLEAGTGAVDLGAALGALRQRGARVVLCEGGPTLLAELVAGGLLDELCLTVAPMLVGGPSLHLLAGPVLPAPWAVRLTSACEADGFLFLRYLAR